MEKSYHLTKRETEVLNLVSEGLSNRQIGECLHISVHTVKANLEHLYDKIGIHSRVAISVWAFKNKILEKKKESYF